MRFEQWDMVGERHFLVRLRVEEDANPMHASGTAVLVAISPVVNVDANQPRVGWQPREAQLVGNKTVMGLVERQTGFFQPVRALSGHTESLPRYLADKTLRHLQAPLIIWVGLFT